MVPGNVSDASTSSQAHRQFELLHKNLQPKLNALLSIVCQAPDRYSPDEDVTRAKSQCFEHIGASSNAAINGYRNLARGSSDTFA